MVSSMVGKSYQRPFLLLVFTVDSTDSKSYAEHTCPVVKLAWFQDDQNKLKSILSLVEV